MPQVEKLLVFLASPGDVPTERRHTREVIDELNGTVAAEKGLVLQVVDWKHNAFPGYGTDAQALINTQIAEMAKYTLFVGIMWNRLGTPTPRAESGTVEEFERAVAASSKAGKPEIWFYFRQAASNLETEDQVEQRKKVLAFKKQVQANGMPWTYRSPSDFRDTFRNHMIGWLGKQSAPVPKHPRDSSKGLKFVSIGIHHRSDKYWREGECSEHRSKISNKAAQYFHMTVFESDSDFWKEHRDPVNADPLFDITVKNESGRSLIFRKVGIAISVVAHENYLWGIPTAVRIPVSANYAVKVPNLRERFQDAYDGSELKPKRLDEVVSIRVPDPYALEPEAPFRYTLRLKNYCENMPNHARLQMWCETDHGEFRSGEIALLRY